MYSTEAVNKIYHALLYSVLFVVNHVDQCADPFDFNPNVVPVLQDDRRIVSHAYVWSCTCTCHNYRPSFQCRALQ